MLMLIQALLAGLVVGISEDGLLLGYNMLNRPIVEGALMGLVLGNVGSTVRSSEPRWRSSFGFVPRRAAVSPDGGTAAGVSTAFAIITGAGAAVGTTRSPCPWRFRRFAFVLCKFLNNAFAEAMKAQLAKDNDKAARALFSAARLRSELSACTSLSAFWVSSSAAPRSRRPSPPSPRRSSTALLPAATCFPPWASRSCSR